MSTRSNIILVTQDNRVDQYYHHWDGYLSGVGEELRKCLLYSIGMRTVDENTSVYSALRNELQDCNDYEFEDSWGIK